MKKILLLLVCAGVATAGYVYYQSQQKPTDTYVATDVIIDNVLTGTIIDTSLITGTETIGTTMSVAQNSVFGWKATKPGGFHTGTIGITDGFVAVSNDMITAGEFTIDMASLKLLDINDPKFEGEIREDFFQATQYPVAKFMITKIESQSTGSIVYGSLTIKDKTNIINFPAQITSSGNTINVKASFAIDRMLRGLDMWKGTVNDYLEFVIDLDFSKAL